MLFKNEMGYKVLKNTEIDKQKWDECICHSQTPDIYALSWYLDIVSPAWCGIVFNNYKAVFPICKSYNFFVFPVLISPYLTKDFTIYGIEEGDLYFQKFAKIVHENLKGYFKKHYFVKNNFAKFVPSKISVKQKQLINFNNYISYPEKTLRKSLRDAALQSYVVKHSIDIDVAISFIKETLIGKKIISDENYFSVLKKILIKGKDLGYVNCSGLYFNGELCAADIYGKVADCLFLIQNAGDENSKMGGMHYLLYEIIECHRENIKFVDFMGSSLPAIQRFNKNFCNVEISYSLIS